MATLYKSNGETIKVEPKDGKNFHLEELYQMLNCTLVERVWLLDGQQMLVDEEGKCTKHDINPKATRLLHKSSISPWDFIVGDALVCSAEEFI